MKITTAKLRASLEGTMGSSPPPLSLLLLTCSLLHERCSVFLWRRCLGFCSEAVQPCCARVDAQMSGDGTANDATTSARTCPGLNAPRFLQSRCSCFHVPLLATRGPLSQAVSDGYGSLLGACQQTPVATPAKSPATSSSRFHRQGDGLSHENFQLPLPHDRIGGTQTLGKGFYEVKVNLFERIYPNKLNFANKLGLPLLKENPFMGNGDSLYAHISFTQIQYPMSR